MSVKKTRVVVQGISMGNNPAMMQPPVMPGQPNQPLNLQVQTFNVSLTPTDNSHGGMGNINLVVDDLTDIVVGQEYNLSLDPVTTTTVTRPSTTTSA